MDYGAYIGLVNTHTKSIGCHHHTHLTGHPTPLSLVALGMRKPGMECICRYTLPPQILGQFFGTLAVAAVDNGGAGHSRENAQHRGCLVAGVPYHIGNVGAQKTSLDNIGFGEMQNTHHILRNQPGSRSRKRQYGRLWEPRTQLSHAHVGGAEVVPPLANAVALVHHNHTHLELR